MIAALAVSVDWLAGNAHYIAAGGLLLAILLVAGANVAIAQARIMMANHDEVRSGEIAAA